MVIYLCGDPVPLLQAWAMEISLANEVEWWTVMERLWIKRSAVHMGSNLTGSGMLQLVAAGIIQGRMSPQIPGRRFQSPKAKPLGYKGTWMSQA